MELSLEREHADTFASQSLSRDEYALWEQCRSSHRFLAFKGKELYIYRFFSNRPEIQNRLVCTDVSLSFAGGFRTIWKDEEKAITVGHAPVMIADSIFLWHVFDSQVEYTPYKGKFGTTMPLAYRSKENPHNRNEGVTYILERTAFEARFNQY